MIPRTSSRACSSGRERARSRLAARGLARRARRLSARDLHHVHGALLHWLDSLAGVNSPSGTAGKTVDAHRRDYERTQGSLNDEDIAALRGWRDARVEFARDRQGSERQGLTEAFFEAQDLEQALSASAAVLPDRSERALRRAVLQFATRYRLLWNDGAVVQEFLERSALDSRTRKELGEFLGTVAHFYGVDLNADPSPCLVLAPVAREHGTHAQTVGRFLLIEIRAGDGVRDQIGPIVHENAHFLFSRIGAERAAELAQAAAVAAPHGERAWAVLAEALPTALAQGLATQRLTRGRWSMDSPWYHTSAVDEYAKRLFPLVRAAIDRGAGLDEAFVREAVARYRDGDGISPR